MPIGVLLASQAFSPVISRAAGNALVSRPGVSFTLNDGSGNPVVHSDQALTTLLSPLVTGSNGEFPGFATSGSYALTVGGVTVEVEVVSGAALAAASGTIDGGTP